MICKCPHCGDVVKYSIEDKSLKCGSCGNVFSAGSVVNEELWEKLETMDCDVYKCSTCGAEITVNDVEAATFCGYCGQPTIVFSRVSTIVKPEKIIPFSVTKEEAEVLIRRKLKKSFFVSKKIKNFEIDRICGIYVPFWLYDVDYSSNQIFKGEVGNGKQKNTQYFQRESECSFTNVTLDASKKLNNTSSGRLEPFDFTEIKDFDIAYLSGFYADCYDVSSEMLNSDAKYKIKELFDAKVRATIPATNVSLISDEPTYSVKSTTYAMLPVWFITFMDEVNNCYTIMVNGQTKKIVGAVPFIKSRIVTTSLTLGAILSIPCIKLVHNIISYGGEDLFKVIVLIIAGIVGSFNLGAFYYDKLKDSIRLTTSKTINKFAKERQDI